MRTKLAVLAAVCAAAAFTVAAAAAGTGVAKPTASPVPNVRVLGRFLMSGKVLVAVGIPGERPGERVLRTWRIRPYRCRESDCQRVVIVRNRGAHRESKLTLRRIGAGEYRGTGSFSAPLKCLGRTYGRGSVARYVITLRVLSWTQVGAIRYATAVGADYVNTGRRDRTRCPLGVVRDAAGYLGTLKSALPTPPVAPTPTTPTPTSTIPTPTTPASPASTVPPPTPPAS